MVKQLYIGIITEGPTDVRFLKSVIERTFQDIAFNECVPDIEIQTFVIQTSKIGLEFCEHIKQASLDGVNLYGIMTLAVHTDADKHTYEERKSNKIVPALAILENLDDNYCKILTPVIPVRMTEAWMLADKELLKKHIGTTENDRTLGIERDPEAISDPKVAIENAIRIAMAYLPKRRHKITLSELYEIMGDAIGLEQLMSLSSYRKFTDEVRNTYRILGYMH